jgi:hypothetical protein
VSVSQRCSPGQLLSCSHATHVLLVASQNGRLCPQSAFWAHSTQTASLSPRAPRQIGVPFGQPAERAPQTHVWLSSQRLLVSVHSLSVRQPAAQVLEAVQYMVSGQSEFWRHSTQVPPSGSQTWSPRQSPLPVHSTHMPLCFPPTQNGVVPSQAVLAGPQTQLPEIQALLSPAH